MRRLTAVVAVIGCWALAFGAPRAEDIGSVLKRSQQMRLDRIEPVDAQSADAQRIRDDFERLLRTLPPMRWPDPLELRVQGASTPLAETLRGNVVVASAALARLPGAERLFVLAHELGHVQLDHAAQMGRLFEKWVPGEVTQQHTDAIAPLLGREAAGLSHRQEFEADAFALRALHAAGFGLDDAMGVFRRSPVAADTATHPGTRRRVAALTAAPAEPVTLPTTAGTLSAAVAAEALTAAGDRR